MGDYNYFVYFVVLYGIVPLLVYFLLPNTTVKEVRFIYPFLWVVCIASLYEFLGTLVFKISSEYWFIVYKLLAFSTILYFFISLLGEKLRLVYCFYSICFLALLLYFSIHWDIKKYLEINSYFNTLQTLVVFTFSIAWFRRVFIHLEFDSLGQSPVFYFVSGLLLYYSGTVFLFLMSTVLLVHESSSFQDYWMLNIGLNLVLRTLLIIGIWKGQAR